MNINVYFHDVENEKLLTTINEKLDQLLTKSADTDIIKEQTQKLQESANQLQQSVQKNS